MAATGGDTADSADQTSTGQWDPPCNVLRHQCTAQNNIYRDPSTATCTEISTNTNYGLDVPIGMQIVPGPYLGHCKGARDLSGKHQEHCWLGPEKVQHKETPRIG